MDQIDAVRAFLEVAERQSFTAAAARLGLSKALVSKHVAGLEERAGARLLNRTTRSVALTEAGNAFHERAQVTVTAWDAMMESASEDARQPKGILRVAGPRVFGELVLADLVAEFLCCQPNLRVDLFLEERRVDVVGEGFDLAVRVGLPEESSLVTVRLTSFPFVLCAAPGYLARRGTPETPHDLAGHDCILNTAVAPNGQWSFVVDGRTTRIAVPARVRVTSDPPVAAFVRAGLGIGLCFRRPVTGDLAAGRIVPVLERHHAYEREVFALLPHRRFMPAKVRLLLDFLKTRLRDR